MEALLSKWTTSDAIGAAWLAHRYAVEPVQPLRTLSRIGRSRSIEDRGNRWVRTYEERYRPKPTFAAHFEFMLRHEVLSLEFLSRLLNAINPAELVEWIRAEPSGRYARRAGFLYEWLLGSQLDFDGVSKGAYVDIFDGTQYFTAFKGSTNTRWHIRNNLPGDPTFCPLVYLSGRVKDALDFDVATAWSDLESEFGIELLERSAGWLTVKESRSSFAIEGEGKQLDRIRRFAIVLETEIARHDNVFATNTLEFLQRGILGERATRYGIRKSPIFVGESRGGAEIVHYIAPHWELAAQMLGGLATCEVLTRGTNPLMRAAVLSFGFVYAHPMTDGNGRLSRFLINDVLRRDGALSQPYVLPISSVIAAAMRKYDHTLEILSKPLMKRYAGNFRFAENVRYDDGLTSTLHFDAYEAAEPIWRYPDLTDHVEYLCDIVRKTVDVELRQEAKLMRAYRKARHSVNEVIEGPDEDLDRIVRSVKENQWAISGKLVSEFPLLVDEATAQGIVKAVMEAFDS